jgi:hypothetical protein
MIRIQSLRSNKRTFFIIKHGVRRARHGLRIGLTEIGKENSRHLKTMIRTGSRTGRWYGNHRASAPGEPPANWTGRLARSVGFKNYGHSRMEFGEVAFYGRFLEDGTRIMAPRPHMKRTVDEKSKDNYNTLAHSVDRELKR